MWSNSTYYVPASYYTQFALTEKDQKDLDNAKALVTHLKDNLSKNIQIINNSTQLNDLKSSLTGFGSMSSNLLNAQLNLMQKLTLMGYKINIQP
jgi:archaellum component FlaC